MALLAAHRHRIAAMRADRLPQRSFRIELLAALIKVGHRQPGAVAHASSVRLQLAKDEAQERRFANAVRPHQTNAVTAHDAGGEVTYYHLLTKRFHDMIEFNNQLAGG